MNIYLETAKDGLGVDVYIKDKSLVEKFGEKGYFLQTARKASVRYVESNLTQVDLEFRRLLNNVRVEQKDPTRLALDTFMIYLTGDKILEAFGKDYSLGCIRYITLDAGKACSLDKEINPVIKIGMYSFNYD